MITSPPFSEFNSVTTMSLATIGDRGIPHSAPVYYVVVNNSPDLHSDWRFYFFSDSESQHAQDILTSKHVAASIYPSCQSWEDIRGLQTRGVAYPVLYEAERERAWSAYSDKFPFVTALKAIVALNSLYAIKPNWVRLIDNRVSFGHKQEWVLEYSDTTSYEGAR